MITKFDAYWVGSGWGNPKVWATKKEMPRFNSGVRAVRLALRFCVGYAALDQNRNILMHGNGGLESWCPVWDFQLLNLGRVIGPMDFSAAGGTKFEAAWRGAAMERRKEELEAA